MATRTREDRRLRLLSAVCLGLPEAERTNCGAHADFRVRGKIFAYFLRNHGGDGITAACFKTRLGEHIEHIKKAPGKFYLPRFIGRRGWLGLRLDQGEIDWDEVRTLAAISYELAAPKSLRAPSAPLANALTAGLLIRGTPPNMNLSRTAGQIADANLLSSGRLTEERLDSIESLRPTAMPEAARSNQSTALRSRR
jgi:predicted DNA-binding protein (MmcQ/YjbR family)